MTKQCSYLALGLGIILAVAGTVGAADPGWTRWTNDGGDGSWTQSANWHEGLPGPATSWTTVHLGLVGAAAPHIHADMTAQAGAHLVVSEYGGTYDELFMDGGTLATSYLIIGMYGNTHGRFEISDGDVSCTGEVYVGERGLGELEMSGGTITSGRFFLSHLSGAAGEMAMSGGTVTCSEFYVGNETTPGTLIMTGGQIETGWLWTPRLTTGTGRLELLGGTISCAQMGTTELAGSLSSRVNLAGGTLVIQGDARSALSAPISNGTLVAYGGVGNLHVAWDAGLGTTTVTGEYIAPPAGACATTPLPADGALYQPLDVTLAWTPGAQAVEHLVYFSTNSAEVAAAAPPAFQGSQPNNTYQPGVLTPGQVYYWRVDESDGVNVCAGPVWTFTATDNTLTDPVFECPLFRFAFDQNGYVNSLLYKPVGRELVSTTAGNEGFVVYNDGPNERLTQVRRTAAGDLFASTSTGSRQLLMTVEEHDCYLTFRIDQLIGMPVVSDAKLKFLVSPNLSGTEGWSIPVLYGEGIGVGVIGLDFMTRSQPRFNVDWSYLWHRGENPADPQGGFALFACDQPDTLDTVGLIEVNEGLPHPMNDGRWAKVNNHTSRLTQMWISYDGVTERNRAVDYVEQAGAGVFYLPQWMWEGSSAYSLSSYHWPGGISELRAFSDQLAARGIKLGIHTGSASLKPADATYVAGQPDDRLATWGTGTLAQAVTSGGSTLRFTPAQGVVLPTIDPAELYGLRPPTYNRIWDYRHFRIGNEIIFAGSIDDSVVPWTLSNCQRGVQGTSAAFHGAGSTVSGMLSAYGLLAVDPDTSLLDEIADRLANLVNQANIARVAFDALETVDHAGRWAMGKFLSKAESRFDHYVAADSSSGLLQYEWHVLSYQNVGEGMHHYPEPYFQGYLVNNVNVAQRSFCPAALGAYTFRLDGLAQHASSPDEWEWWLAKTAAYDACYFFETDIDSLDQHGQTDIILDRARQWEQIRLAGVLGVAQRTALQDFDTSCRLTSVGADDATWQITPLRIDTDFVLPDDAIGINNPYAAQPPRYEIRVLPGFDYASAENIALLPASVGDLNVETGLNVTKDADQWSFASTNSGMTPGAAVEAQWYLPTEYHLGSHRGVGFMMTGDGNGGYFYVEYRDNQYQMIRHYVVPNDFVGTRYVEIPTPEVCDYRYLDDLYHDFGPDSSWHSIKLHFRFDRIGRVAYGLVQVPAGTTATVQVSGLKALREMPTTLADLDLAVGGGNCHVAGPVYSGEYLVYEGGGTAQRLDANRHWLGDLVVTTSGWSADPGTASLSLATSGAIKPWLKVQTKFVGTPFDVSNPLHSGDINGDGKVNFADLLLLLDAWLVTEHTGPEDLNDDDRVDMIDFGRLSNTWNPD